MACLTALAACGARTPAALPMDLKSQREAAPREAVLDAPPSGHTVWMRVDDLALGWLNLGAEHPSSEFPVEWLADGSVLLPGHPIARRLPDELRRSPTPMRALGLYVQRAVKLHLDGLDGPIVGEAFPGAFLPIFAPGPRVTEVVLIAYGVHAFVESDALGIDRVDLADVPIESDEYYDWELSIRASPDAPPFASTSCGPIHVVTREGTRAKVSQVRDGVWIVGWVDELPAQRRDTHRCLPRIVQLPGPPAASWAVTGKLPNGYVAVSGDASLQDPLGSLLLRGGSLYWPFTSADTDTVACLEWHVKPAIRKKDPGVDRYDRVTAMRRQRGKDDKGITEYELAYVGREGAHSPELSIAPHADANGDADCAGSYTIVAADLDRVRLIDGYYPRGIAAYHPEDTEDWYFERAACEAAAARMNGPGPGLNRVRLGC